MSPRLTSHDGGDVPGDMGWSRAAADRGVGKPVRPLSPPLAAPSDASASGSAGADLWGAMVEEEEGRPPRWEQLRLEQRVGLVVRVVPVAGLPAVAPAEEVLQLG